MKKRTAILPNILLEQSVDSQGSSWGDNSLVAMELGSDYGLLDPGCDSVLVPDPSQVERFSQKEDVRHPVNTTSVLTTPSQNVA